MSIKRLRSRQKRLHFLIVYLLSHGWVVKLSSSGRLRFKRPGKHSYYAGSLRHSRSNKR